MAEFEQILTKLQEDYQKTLDTNSGQAYSKLSTVCEGLGKYFREYIQELTAKDMEKIINKIGSGESLTAAEKAEVKLWIVGDAEYYVKMENNFQDWKDELARLMGEINHYKTATPDVTTVSKLRALFRDASRVLADIFYYLQQKERIGRFEQSIETLKPQDSQILVRLLEQKMRSPDF